jgi:hypothetical protein
MSNLKLCQGNKCHTYHTKDRIRGTQGDKHYETRRRSSMYYGNNNFCSLNCQNDWFELNGNRAIDHFGRLKEAKRNDCADAWYKDYKYDYRNGESHYQHYLVNDLIGKKIPITQEQYSDDNYTVNSLNTS